MEDSANSVPSVHHADTRTMTKAKENNSITSHHRLKGQEMENARNGHTNGNQADHNDNRGCDNSLYIGRFGFKHVKGLAAEGDATTSCGGSGRATDGRAKGQPIL